MNSILYTPQFLFPFAVFLVAVTLIVKVMKIRNVMPYFASYALALLPAMAGISIFSNFFTHAGQVPFELTTGFALLLAALSIVVTGWSGSSFHDIHQNLLELSDEDLSTPPEIS